MFPLWRRRQQCSRKVCIICGHALIILIVTALITPFLLQADALRVDCIEQLTFWLLVYIGVELLHIFERIAAACSWMRANNPANAEGRLFLFVRIWLYLGEVAWVIYGTTFAFNEEMDECASDSIKAGVDLTIADMISLLRWSTKFLIIYGYLLILYLLCSCCIGVAVYRTYTSFV